MYASAASVIDSELDPIAQLEESLNHISVSKSIELKNVRSLGLEFLKGRINCLKGSVSFRNGIDQSFENNLSVAKSLPMTFLEKSLYYLELAKIRSTQFFESYGKIDQGVFNESVSILYNSAASKLKTIVSRPICQRVEKLETLLVEAFLSVGKYGKPDDAQMLANILCKLYMLKENVILERDNRIFEKTWNII